VAVDELVKLILSVEAAEINQSISNDKHSVTVLLRSFLLEFRDNKRERERVVKEEAWNVGSDDIPCSTGRDPCPFRN
jgi:hypothetical protein